MIKKWILCDLLIGDCVQSVCVTAKGNLAVIWGTLWVGLRAWLSNPTANMAPVGEVTCTHDSEKNSDPASGSGNPQSNPASGSGCGSSPKLGLTDKSKEKPHKESSDSASSSRGSGSSKSNSSGKRSSSTASGSDKHAKKSNSKSSDDITSLADVQGAFSNTLREMMETQMAMFQSMLQQHRSCPDPVLVAGSFNGRGFPLRSEAEEGEEEEWSGAPPHLEPDMALLPWKRGREREHRSQVLRLCMRSVSLRKSLT